MKTSRTNKPKRSATSTSKPREPKKKEKNGIEENLKSTPKKRIDIRRRSNQARKRLGVTAEQMEGVLKIAPSLKESGLGIDRVVEILEGDDSADSQAFIAKWKTISKSDKKYLTIEEICVASGLTTRRLWSAISGARFVQAASTVKMLLADGQPGIVRAAIKAATDSVPITNEKGMVVGYSNGDIRAMDMVAGWTGLKPRPKGALINFYPPSKSEDEDEGSDDEDDDDEELLPDMGTFLKDVQNVITPPKQLSAPSSEVVPATLKAEFEDVKIVR
jgi:hypothetical protein